MFRISKISQDEYNADASWILAILKSDQNRGCDQRRLNFLILQYSGYSEYLVKKELSKGAP
jgi:hypothetical protein